MMINKQDTIIEIFPQIPYKNEQKLVIIFFRSVSRLPLIFFYFYINT